MQLQLLCLMLVSVPAAAAAQVNNETRLDSAGYATTLIQNSSPEIVDVEIELRHGSVSKEGVNLGETVNAVVSPSRFQLGPGESQLVRLLLREPLASDSVVRLVTTLTPRAARPVRSGGVSAQLHFATRLITKVIAR